MLKEDAIFDFETEEKSEAERKDEIRRAKLRALHLLTAMDRTEAQLREKLQSSYDEEVVDIAFEYAKNYGYINDERYVRVYIESKSRTKSRKQIEQELILKKGVSKELVERGFEEAQMADVSEVIKKYMQKKKIDPENCEYEQKQKFFAYMMRKGFQIEDMKRVFDLT